MKEKIVPVHPCEILLEDFLKPMSLSQNRLALDKPTRKNSYNISSHIQTAFRKASIAKSST